MGLENLSSPFADISKNSMEPQRVNSANSVIKSINQIMSLELRHKT